MRLSISILALMYVVPTAILWGMFFRTLEPDERARLSIVPERISLEAKEENGVSYSLGYGTFRLPREAELTRRAPAMVNVETSGLLLGLLPPRKAEDAREILDQKERMAFDWWWGWLGKSDDWKAAAPRNMVDAYQSDLEAAPQPGWRQVLMGPGESLALIMKLLVKSLVLQPDVQRVLYFSAPETFGVIMLEEGGTRGNIHLSTRDRMIEQLMLFRLTSALDQFPGSELSAFLSTYELSLNPGKTEEELSMMIAGAGISEDPNQDRWRSNRATLGCD